MENQFENHGYKIDSVPYSKGFSKFSIIGIFYCAKELRIIYYILLSFITIYFTQFTHIIQKVARLCRIFCVCTYHVYMPSHLLVSKLILSF